MISLDKIRGMFLGVQVGDTLGKPVETWDAGRIASTYGRLTEIVAPSAHKWFNGQPAGTWTDDTQLTLAVAEGLIDSNGVENGDEAMAAQAKSHVKAMRESTSGWGRSTRDSVRRLANGAHWMQSGEKGDKGSGRGNGVPMKIGPLGAYLAFTIGTPKASAAIRMATHLSLMTHLTSISASAALAQMVGVYYCLTRTPENFVTADFVGGVVRASTNGRKVLPETIGGDDITTRLELLRNHENYDSGRIISEFGGGSCYCYNSVPFTLMFFVKNHKDGESLYDVTNAGGDTDSNASMLGALLGALHGTQVFPSHLTDALDPDQKQVVLDVADKFYDTFRGN